MFTCVLFIHQQVKQSKCEERSIITHFTDSQMAWAGSLGPLEKIINNWIIVIFQTIIFN